MRRNIVVVVVSLSVAIIFGVVGAVYAQTGSQPNSVQEYKTVLQTISTEADKEAASLRENGARNCQLSANYLKRLYRQADVTLAYRTDNYQVIIDQANQLAITREASDLSVDELRVVIAELSDRVTDFSASYGLYRAELLEAANIACNEQTELRATISRALSALRTAEFNSERVADYAQGEFARTVDELGGDE